MAIEFSKISATGNDFIVFDNRANVCSQMDNRFLKAICQRRTGIGADGVLMLENSAKADFKMRYYNSDGLEAKMCGNGARAITFFANICWPDSKKFQFETLNGVYSSRVLDNKNISVQMVAPSEIGAIDLAWLQGYKRKLFLNTGVPHLVLEVDDLSSIDVVSRGRELSHDPHFKSGVNVNFYQILSNGVVRQRTYERGVEDETLSCGTGAMAVSFAVANFNGFKDSILLEMSGGQITIEFDDKWQNIFLLGKVDLVFRGFI